jgi:biopolymer transport protein ExbD/biopolymer transport protein TolR
MAGKIGSAAAFGGSPLPELPGSAGTDVNADINMTPMIDVMLVLLIIFMIITPAMGAAVKLPQAANVIPQKDEDRVTLSIEKDGKFYLQSKPVHPDNLQQALIDLYLTRPDDRIMFLKADQAVQYSVVLTAIDYARNAGVRKVGAITDAAKAATP